MKKKVKFIERESDSLQASDETEQHNEPHRKFNVKSHPSG